MARTSSVSRWRIAALLLVGSTTLGLLSFAYKYLDDVATAAGTPLLEPLVEELTGHWGAVLIIVPVLLLMGRLRVSERPWAARLAFHAAGLALYSALHTTLNWLSREAAFPLLGLGDYDYGILSVRYAMELPKDVGAYTLSVLALALFDRYRSSRDRELRTSRLEARLARAQLQNLQAQLNPHFLFNALNTVSSVMYEDVVRADRMLSALSDLLRRALQASHRHEVTVAEEMEVLGIYVELMRARFGERLDVVVAVDEEVRAALLPTLLLQPLVENAIHHGAPPPPEPARIEVRAWRDGDVLVVQVDDDGPGLGAAEPRPGTGVGLANTRERLRGLYGERQSITLRDREGAGLRVSVRVPFHEGPIPEPAPEEAWSVSAS